MYRVNLLNSLSKYKLSVYLKLLYINKRYAKRVVTTRLHCPLPCIAMGIPVIFFGYPDDYRTSIIGELGLYIHKIPHQKTTRESTGKKWGNLFNSVNWAPVPIDIHLKKDESSMTLARKGGMIIIARFRVTSEKQIKNT